MLIKTTEENIFEQYLTLINPILGANKLKPIEISVLAKLLYIDYKYKHLSQADRDTIIFAKETKIRIRLSLLNMSEASFNNIMMKLRQKKLITKEKLLLKVPIKDGEININYKLKLNVEEA